MTAEGVIADRALMSAVGTAPVPNEPPAVMIEFSHLSVRFDSVVALDDLSGHVAAGEWIGVIGANGAGKTTLLRTLAHLQAHEGVVRVSGHPLHELSRRRRARLVAYVPQKPELPPGMSAFQYTLLGRTPHHSYFGDVDGTDRERCRLILEQLELARLAHRELRSLSGGEQQRVVLARALAQDTPVLLMDEPTSALDLGRRVEALELVDRLRRDRGLTIVTALHDLTLAGQFVDRLILMSGGTILTTGPPQDVLNEATLSECYGTSVQVVTTWEGDAVVIPRRHGSAGNTAAGRGGTRTPGGGPDDHPSGHTDAT